ncbi:MAG: triose-phosphate isomerase [Chloroflexi bacterium]|nr:triose-phosphate isomerase [Chloroflexota bacterium]
MTRIPILAGNWKMNKTPVEAAELAASFAATLGNVAAAEVVLCPPFVSLPAVQAATRGTRLGLGAQDVHWEKSGAFTGEVSAPMLAGWCTHVIIGHSERRQYFGETDETVNKKVKAALAHNLTPIICVGELLAEYEAGQTGAVVARQVRGAYDGLTAEQAAKTVIAYEPVWAIGTGKAATGAGANAVIGLNIRGVVADLFGSAVADGLRVQYGGSVTPANIAEFMAQPDIDGALVGGASLKPADFQAIVEAAIRAKALDL